MFKGVRLRGDPEKRCYYSMVATYYVQNFGCRATQADGAAIERQLEERGLERATSCGDAHVVVLNTCTVTAAADQDSRAAIRRAHRENPQARIVVTGCYAQRSPDEIAALPGVTQVIGNSHKHQLAEIALADLPSTCANDLARPSIKDFVGIDVLTNNGSARDRSTTGDPPQTDDQAQVFVSDIFAHTELLAAPVFDAANERTRPNLKIQDGCDNRCSFCVIPFVRGQSRSMKLEQIIAEVNTLVSSGYRELVISGINLGRWGRDLEGAIRFPVFGFRENQHPRNPQTACEEIRRNGAQSSSTTIALSPEPGRTPNSEQERPDLVSLVRAILDSTNIEKLRISSVEPMDWSNELIALVAESPRIAKHAHVPMQSGSDTVLRRMHRKYRPWHYREKIEKIRAAMATAAIGADVMVGFPGETDAEFEETRRMIEELPFTYLHVFTYSARPGTSAANLPRQVPVHLARQRNRILRDLAAEKKHAFMQSFVGKTVEAITLARGSDSLVGPDSSPAASQERGANTPVRNRVPEFLTEALTDNYLPLVLREKLKANQWLQVRIEGVRDGKLVGA